MNQVSEFVICTHFWGRDFGAEAWASAKEERTSLGRKLGDESKKFRILDSH